MGSEYIMSYNIKNHRLNYNIEIGEEWAVSFCFFCKKEIAEFDKILFFKKNNKNFFDDGKIDIEINKFLSKTKTDKIDAIYFANREIYDIYKKTEFLWVIEKNNNKYYFDSIYLGWIKYRIEKMKIKTRYEINEDEKLLLIYNNDKIIAGLIGLNL